MTLNTAGTAKWADALLQSFAQAGYLRAEPAILQPADPFLDLSGEDIRKSLYLTTDANGEELCLRPDLTIPVARDYLASAKAGKPAGFSYLGPVFRFRGGRPSEFLQAGIESFGRQDRAAADAEMLALALEATSAFGLKDVEIRTGDVALFIALIDALELYPVWRRRLIKDFNRKVNLAEDIERLTLATAPAGNEYQGVLAALAGSDRKAALALVTDLMSIAGTTNVGGRTVAEIADRFLEQSTLKGGALPRDALKIIKRFMEISGDPDDSVAQLRALASDAKLDKPSRRLAASPSSAMPIAPDWEEMARRPAGGGGPVHGNQQSCGSRSDAWKPSFAWDLQPAGFAENPRNRRASSLHCVRS